MDLCWFVQIGLNILSRFAISTGFKKAHMLTFQ